MTAAELLRRAERHVSPRGQLSAIELERWLLDSGFAVNGSPDGRLRPTPLGLEVGYAVGNIRLG